MTKQILSVEPITVEEIGQILRIIRDGRNLTNSQLRTVYREHWRSAANEGHFSDSMFNRVIQDRKPGEDGKVKPPPNLRPQEIGPFLRFIGDSMTESDWDALASKQGDLVKRLTAPALDLSNAMSHWLGSYFQNPPEIQHRSGEENGRFLILRLDRESGGLISSYMRVHPATRQSPMPRFTTTREGDDGRPRDVEGIFFMSGGLFYSFGKSSGSGGFRATIQRPLVRPDREQKDRFDMFGVRVGRQDDPELAYSYPIYCYQMKRHRSELELENLIGKKGIDDKFLKRQIDGFDKIISRLRSAARYEYGVLAQLTTEELV